MTATGDESTPAPLSPDEAFGVLGNETRFEIIQTLWELYDPDDSANVVKFADLYDGETTVAFSDLFDAVDYDSSGNFNYHLEQLTDHFVRQSKAGYELTEAGLEIAQAIVAGTVREHPAFETVTIDETCPLCEAPVDVSYTNHHVQVSCSECLSIWQNAAADRGILFTFPLPPVGLSDRTPEEVFHATLTYNLHRIRSFIDGVCPVCSSAVEESLDICDQHEPTANGCPQCHRLHQIEVAERCGHCKAVARGPLTVAILAHPIVTAFYHDQGIDHRFASWETFNRGATVEESILQRDPLRIDVTIPCEGDTLRLQIDESLEIVETVE